jgi:cation/acetate symporter
MMGVFSKKVSGPAAVWGMCCGIGVTMLYVFQHKGIMFIPGTDFLGDMKEDWFLGISPNAFGAVGAVVNFAVAFIVTKVTGDAPDEIQHMVDNFRHPRGAGTAHEH